jgi:hypothetical protein
MGNFTDFLSGTFSKLSSKGTGEVTDEVLPPKPQVLCLIPRSHVVKALQWTGDNFSDISLLVPNQFRAFMPNSGRESGRDYLVVQTPSGTKFVNPGSYIVQGRVGSAIGFFVFTEEELVSTFDILKE